MHKLTELYDIDLVRAFLKTYKYTKRNALEPNTFYQVKTYQVLKLGKSNLEETYQKIQALPAKSVVLIMLIQTIEVEGQSLKDCPIYVLFNSNDILYFIIHNQEWIFLSPSQDKHELCIKKAFELLTKNQIAH